MNDETKYKEVTCLRCGAVVGSPCQTSAGRARLSYCAVRKATWKEQDQERKNALRRFASRDGKVGEIWVEDILMDDPESTQVTDTRDRRVQIVIEGNIITLRVTAQGDLELHGDHSFNLRLGASNSIQIIGQS